MPVDDQQMDFMSKFISLNRVPETSRRHFAAVEWTRQYLENPQYRPIPTFSRVLKDTGEDYFFARTINSPSTIPHLVTLQRKDFRTPPERSRGALARQTDHTQRTAVPEHPDCIMLLHLAKPGLDGHPATLHGGMSCAILDEMMGLTVMLHHQHFAGPRDSLYTANLNVTYRAPIVTQSNVVVRCWLLARQGRKWLAQGQIVDEHGVVLAEAEGLWLLAKHEEKL